MAKLLKLRRGTTTQHGSFTGAEGEVTVDTDKETLVVHDGSTAGGHPVAAEDMANVSSASIAGRLATDSIAVGKIAAGTLPSDVKIADANISGNLTIESADIVNGTIATADIADGAVTAAKIASQTITADRIAANAVGTSEIVDAAVTNAKLATDSVTGSKIAASAVNTSEIADDAVTQAKMADNAIGSSQLANNAVYTAAIQDDAVTNAKIADNAIQTVQIAVSQVTTNRLADEAVSFAKMQHIGTDSFLGRDSSGVGDVENLSASTVRTILNVEDGATADQTGAEIASALGAQNIYTTGNIGRDANDYIQWGDNAQLDVYVNNNNEFRFEADGDFHADGDVYAFSTTVASDENLKKDITIVGDSVTKVEGLKGVTFKWKENDSVSAGLIAQDVEKVLPEVVKTVTGLDGNTYKAVNYGGITSILVEAIKDLSARVKALEAK